MKRAIALALVAGIAAVLATTAVARPDVAAEADAQQAVNCNSTLKIAIVTPLTGGAGFLGNAQLSWAKYAVKRLAPGLGLKVQLLTGDTPVEQGPAPAQALAQKYVADQKVVAVIGPATSGAVAATSKTYFAAGVPHISPSATRTSLTKGTPREGTPGFFRVVPGDFIQGPSDARYMIDKLNVKKVVLIDFQEPYSVGLADAAEAVLKARNVATVRLSTSVRTTDFSSLVTRTPSDADIVFFPTQQPPDAQTFGQQLIEQGKKAKVFGGDGANSPAQFKLAGSYVSNFAPDISGIATSKTLIDGWKRDNPNSDLESFGTSDLRGRPGRAACGQGGMHREQERPAEPACSAAQGEAGPHLQLDPRRQLPLLHEVERPAEREVLHLPDPVERHVQARRLTS